MNPVSEFEHAFAERCGVNYAVAVNSGTSALHTALQVANIGGGEVIMPALCPAMDAFVIIHAGGVPVFADVDPATHLVTWQTIAAKMTNRTAAIIAVSLHGLPVDMDPIMDMLHAGDMHIVVIDDCAQCLLGHYNDKASGTTADIGCFSFEKKKHMTTGSEGGMCTTNIEPLARDMRKFAGLGYKHMTADAGRTSLSAAEFQRPDYERFDTVGLNYRMSEVQAGIGLATLPQVGSMIDRRRQIASMYAQAISGCEWLVPQTWTYSARHSYYSFAVEFKGRDWIKFYNDFVMRGGDGFYAMPKVPYQEPALSGKWSVSCPVAEGLQQRLMLFKTHYRKPDEAKRQAEILSKLIDEWGR